MANHAYFDRYDNLAFTRDDEGVLLMRFHTGAARSCSPVKHTRTSRRPSKSSRSTGTTPDSF